ncbi:MAG: hypothetical protein Q8N46_00950 [Anaerolineales bacterium]|nr:hypothetical protein [Anaerolineales bacterium]
MDSRFLRNVIIKGLVLFLILDLSFAALPASLGKLSFYNHLFAGRQRFPFGEDSSQSYNLSLFNLDVMFASHIISNGLKPADEYRVIVIGDSSTWGTLLRPEETLAGQLDAAGRSLCGKTMRVYNLGYPTISLTKDLMVLDYALRYQPDLVIWLVSLEAFPADKQLSSLIVANNAARVDELIARYNLPLDPNDPALVRPGFWDSTLIGQRRTLADLFRLQTYGVLWTATGIDQTYPADYQRAQTDFNTDITFHNMQPPTLDASQLAFGLLEAGLRIAGGTPVILINEPMLISVGENSDLRYNFLYPRWAYDQWREMMSARAEAGGWNYLDFWNIIPADEFTNSAIHLTPAGESTLFGRVEQTTLQQSCP